ncbi:MAG: hypothetical protein HMLIMOIP_002065 [Candidatus Nitrosomirales archaeon]|jgi:hypothetical protein
MKKKIWLNCNQLADGSYFIWEIAERYKNPKITHPKSMNCLDGSSILVLWRTSSLIPSYITDPYLRYSADYFQVIIVN